MMVGYLYFWYAFHETLCWNFSVPNLPLLIIFGISDTPFNNTVLSPWPLELIPCIHPPPNMPATTRIITFLDIFSKEPQPKPASFATVTVLDGSL